MKYDLAVSDRKYFVRERLVGTEFVASKYFKSNFSRYCLRPQMEYGENLRNPNGIKIIRSGAENNFNAIRI